jgi:hypothetical protein
MDSYELYRRHGLLVAVLGCGVEVKTQEVQVLHVSFLSFLVDPSGGSHGLS